MFSQMSVCLGGRYLWSHVLSGGLGSRSLTLPGPFSGEYVQGVGTNPSLPGWGGEFLSSYVLSRGFSGIRSLLGVGTHPNPIHGTWDTVDKQAVCILLKCFLVPSCFYTNVFDVNRVPIRDWNNRKMFSSQGSLNRLESHRKSHKML